MPGAHRRDARLPDETFTLFTRPGASCWKRTAAMLGFPDTTFTPLMRPVH